VPPTGVYEVELDGDVLRFGTPTAEITVPDEFYLREMAELDLDDPEAIAAFSRSYGRLGDPSFTDLPRRSRDRWTELDELIGPHLRPNETLENRFCYHIREFVEHGRVLHALARMQTVGTTGDSILDIWEPLGFERPTNEDAARFWFFQFLNAGLRPFHMRFEFVAGEARLGRPYPNLYQALCLQVANHVIKGARFKRCANENCGRAFFRQRDRSRYGSHRTEGVRFCSNRCARLQAQREYRRRKKKSGGTK
jgi:hypothetical protein